ncbi:MAG: DNA adenine methylase [Sandaracinaceae bacterium]|nr:DNA adenine methylase [Sandaracinaceae bacterium]
MRTLYYDVVHSAPSFPAPSPLPRESGPFLKWAGGKSRLVPQLLRLLPEGVERMRHIEPFAGGAAFFFARRPKRALLADINEPLINTYRCVRDQVDQVIEALRELATKHGTGRYYEVRAEYNATKHIPPHRRAAMFIYLNKTCFNGLHRVNRRGEFNVPEGKYKNPRILDEPQLRAASQALQNAELHCGDFEEILDFVKPGDFVYLDPPYEPISGTSNFTSYAKAEGFTRKDQFRLKNVFCALDRRGAKVMLSNSDVPFIRELYREYRIDQVFAPRLISCDVRSREPVPELVIRNF